MQPGAAPQDAWDTADALAADASEIPPEPPAPVTPYAGGAAPGKITATPTQATAEGLNTLAQKQDVTTQGAEEQAAAHDEQAGVLDQAAAQKQKDAADYAHFRAESDERHTLDHQRTMQAYQDYAAKAGSLKDPSSQFWEDKGTGAQMLSGLAAFASGLGAGLTGQGGNPFLDYLNKRIDGNYAAHKQNISDLFDKQVAAGKIADTEDNWTHFQDEAKLKFYDLAHAHVQDMLKSVEQRALGQNVKNLAKQTNLDIEKQKIDMRAGLSHAQAVAAQAAAAAAAADRKAREKEMRESFVKVLDAHDKDLPQEERIQGAFKALGALGYRDEELAPFARGVGAVPGEKPGSWALPKVEGAGVPRQTPEEREKAAQIQTKVDAITSQIGKFLEDPAVTAPGGLISGAQGVLPSSLQPQHIQDQGAKLNEIGSLMTSAIGSVAKDADGKPTKVMIERYHEKFEPTLADPPHVRQNKIASGLEFYKELARSEGAKIEETPAPAAAPKPAGGANWAAFGGVRTQ